MHDEIIYNITNYVYLHCVTEYSTSRLPLILRVPPLCDRVLNTRTLSHGRVNVALMLGPKSQQIGKLGSNLVRSKEWKICVNEPHGCLFNCAIQDKCSTPVLHARHNIIRIFLKSWLAMSQVKSRHLGNKAEPFKPNIQHTGKHSSNTGQGITF